MRKTLAITLISLHLFGNTELAQLFSLPQLLRHYHSHCRQNHSLSFMSFLFQHYCGDDGTHKDDNEDAQLPFHNFHHACLTINNIAPVEIPQELTHPVFPDINAHWSVLKEDILSQRTAVILQPPRTLA